MSDSWKPADIETIIKSMAEHGVASLRLGGLEIVMQAARDGQAQESVQRGFYEPVVNPLAEPSLAQSPSEINKALEKLKKTASQYKEWGSMKPPVASEPNG